MNDVVPNFEEIKKRVEHAKKAITKMPPEEQVIIDQISKKYIETGCIRCGSKESEAFYFEEEGYICEECHTKRTSVE